ncbi:MAG: cobalamin-dependent protein [Erythrobacter sp.]|uniref:cobalamin B12-binding domain-containing protein n=1 Tax=Erythrobacter sp. TaxID=1042 RepID=UPI003C72944A
MSSGPVTLKRMLEPLRWRKSPDQPPQSQRCHHDPFDRDTVATIIESDIVPRLLMAHSIEPLTVRDRPQKRIDDLAVSRFAELPMTLEAAGLLDEVDRFIEAGVSVESVYIDLLAPAARSLGEMWTRDECDFVEVTMGLWRLQEVMREISGRYPSIRQSEGPAPRMACLFSPVPGDDHSFGALMIDDVFSRAGWESEVVPQPVRRELLDAVSRRPFDLIGLTVSRECAAGTLRSLITALRKASANPHVAIMVGGRRINEDPALVADVGADGTGTDARAALDVARRLVKAAPARASSQQ